MCLHAHSPNLAQFVLWRRTWVKTMKMNAMPAVGFEPTRLRKPADLKSAPLDHSGKLADGVWVAENYNCLDYSPER